MTTAILRPNGIGDETAIASQEPASGDHWDKVDEETSDDDTSYVYTTYSVDQRDLYALSDISIGAATINSVTVVIMVRKTPTSTNQFAFTSIKTNNVVYDGTQRTLSTVYQLEISIYYTNPQTGNAWTESEVNALQAGVKFSHYSSSPPNTARCTQVYVEVDYTPPPSAFRPQVIFI